MRRHGRLWTILVVLLLLGGATLHTEWDPYRPAMALGSTPDDLNHFRAVTTSQMVTPVGGSFYTTTISIPTYPYAEHLTRVYTSTYNMSYARLDWDAYKASRPTPAVRDYLLLVMENDYLYVTLLPELGGRVYQMIFKPTGHNELYQNPVIKPTDWGPQEQGWWLAAGGIEWALPVEEHGYEWGEAWDYQVITSTEGITVTLRDTSANDRLRAAVEVHLPAAQSYLEITPHIDNPTDSDIDFKYWTNGMLAPGADNMIREELRFAFNAEEVAVHSTGDDRLPGHDAVLAGPDYRFSWPIYRGIDFSRLGNWREWLGFFEYPQAAADFAGVYDTSADEGLARVFPSGIARGSKGFSFGWLAAVDPHKWTDDGSTYVELHGGLAPTFWDAAHVAAGGALEWTETWYPVADIGCLSAATAEAALGVRQDNGRFAIGVHSTVGRAAGTTALYICDRADSTQPRHWALPEIDPGNPFSISVTTGGRTLTNTTFAYLDDAGNLLAAVNPYDCLEPVSAVLPLPPWTETTSFTVTWAGQDAWTHIAAYDVQVRQGYEGTWTDWLTETTALSSTFTGIQGQTYFFRCRGRDAQSNQEAYGDEEWGQAFTTVLTRASPVLVTSRKSAIPRVFAPDQRIAYTILISNTGNLIATVGLTDTLPPTLEVVTDTLTAATGLTLIEPNHAIYWRGVVTPGHEVEVTYVLSPSATTPFGTALTNTVEISGSVLGPLIRREVVVQTHLVWLPLVVREWGL